MSVLDRWRLRRRSRDDSHTLTCSELVEVITEYLDGALSPADRARFDAHLDLCEGCRNYLDQMRLTIRAVGRLREEAITPLAKDALLGAFRTYKHG
ncbi:MAG TPA: zf-HC2 domain-containing protein [Actinomycetota bacterium]|nr:zf-HC2 domain-containing protein [Actinomycetota bacterium]